MNIVVTGASGLVGSKLVPFLTAGDHEVTRLGRARGAESAATWDPARGTIDAAALASVGGVVHLAGEGIATRRWSSEQKERIRRSRVDGTRLLAETLAKAAKRPEVLVSASAIGFYGSRGDELLDEASASGQDFLASVCREWEAATGPARDAGIRVVNLRFGIILSPDGGALGKMLTPFKLGAGGRIGDGQQYMSWIAIDDVIGVIHHALNDDTLSGPVNVVAPVPVTNQEFTKTLGRVLGRPTIFPMPAFAARLAFGEMADALLLGSQRVAPKQLLASDYKFHYPDLEGALRHVLGR